MPFLGSCWLSLSWENRGTAPDPPFLDNVRNLLNLERPEKRNFLFGLVPPRNRPETRELVGKIRTMVGGKNPPENRSARHGPPGRKNTPGTQQPGTIPGREAKYFHKIPTPNIRGHEMDDGPAFRAPTTAKMMPGALGSHWDQF